MILFSLNDPFLDFQVAISGDNRWVGAKTFMGVE